VAADTPAIYINLTALFGGKVTEARNAWFLLSIFAFDLAFAFGVLKLMRLVV
jgi:hypothetical protein